jgi:hypothetical protein
MQDIGIGVGRPAQVDRPEGSKSVYLTSCGANEAKVSGHHTRVRIAMPATQAARFWREFGERRAERRGEGRVNERPPRSSRPNIETLALVTNLVRPSSHRSPQSGEGRATGRIRSDP